jgi:DNA-directed RNA polymerase specialized sigma24 family protein
MLSDFLARLISKPSSGAAPAARERPSLTASDDWGRLMVAAQNGHGGAYRRLLGEVSAWLTRYFQRRLPPGDVDDTVQETLLAIHRRPGDELSDEISVGDHEASVISSLVLASLLEELRPAQAQAIMLVKVQGYSIEDASGMTGLSPSAIKMNIHRGLARLTAFIEETSDVE